MRHLERHIDFEDARIQIVLSEGVQRNSDKVLEMSGERIQIPLKAGHHRSASETPFFKWRLAGGPIIPNTECRLGRGSGPVLPRNPIALRFDRGSGPPPPLDPRMVQSTFINSTCSESGYFTLR